MAESPKLSALKQLANSLPVANSKVAAGQAAARDMQLQAAVKAAPAAPAASSAQTTGAALASTAGQQQVANAQQQAQQLTAVAGLGQQQQGQELQASMAGLRAGARDQQMAGEQKLAAISEQAKREMFDSRKQFAQDEMGRKFTNERQLADYARLRARTDEEWKDYSQKTEQLAKRNSQLLDAARNKIAVQLEQENTIINQLQDQANNRDLTQAQQEANRLILSRKIAQREQLMRMELELKQSIAKKQAKAANNAAMMQGIGTVGGAVVGGFFGGPAGAMVGASAGGALGSLAASQMNK